MSVNRRTAKYKSDKEFEKESDDGFISKTQLKKQAQDLKGFGAELLELNLKVIKKLPIGEVTLKSLLDYEKMNSNLARKRHLMFIGKCLRSEDVDDIKEFLSNKERKSIDAFQQITKANDDTSDSTAEIQATSTPKSVEQLIPTLVKAKDTELECFLENNSRLERQTLRQLIRNCNAAKNENKKAMANKKLIEYLKTNKVNSFSLQQE